MENTTTIKLLKLYKENPDQTLRYYSTILNISRERVRQILKKNNIVKAKLKYNKECKKTPKTCLYCNKEYLFFSKNSPLYMRKFCNNICQYDYNYLIVQCASCKRYFRKSREILRIATYYKYSKIQCASPRCELIPKSNPKKNKRNKIIQNNNINTLSSKPKIDFNMGCSYGHKDNQHFYRSNIYKTCIICIELHKISRRNKLPFNTIIEYSHKFAPQLYYKEIEII